MSNLLKYNSMSFCGVDVWGDLRGGNIAEIYEIY